MWTYVVRWDQQIKRMFGEEIMFEGHFPSSEMKRYDYLSTVIIAQHHLH